LASGAWVLRSRAFRLYEEPLMETENTPRDTRHCFERLGRRSAAALALFVLSAALILASGLLSGPGQESFADSGRDLLVKAAAPTDVEGLFEARFGSTGFGESAPSSKFDDGDPLAETARFRRLDALSSTADQEGRAAFTRLIVRILSPLSRRSWG